MNPNPRIGVCDCDSPLPDGGRICEKCRRWVDDVHITEEAMDVSRKSTAPKKPLFCIAYEERIGRNWKGSMLYVHAIDEADARLQYLYSERPKVLRQRNIVGIARVIGYFVNDSQGDDLSVD